jgi:hypothetical protein
MQPQLLPHRSRKLDNPDQLDLAPGGISTPHISPSTCTHILLPTPTSYVRLASGSTTAPSSHTSERLPTHDPSDGDAVVLQGQPSLSMPAQKPKLIAKRRRRAPSPSRWVPLSLLTFDLCPVEATKATSVPLPPVMPATFEERNSWDTSFGRRPYYPEEWSGRLPGPGFAGGKRS